MPELLEAELSLDLASAQRDIESLGRDTEESLTSAIEAFADKFSSTASDLPSIEPTIETGGITSDLTSAIDEGIGAADTQVALDLDTSEAQSSLDALSDTPLDIDVTEAAESIESLNDIQLAFDLDLTDAQSSVDALGSSLSDAGGLGGGFDAVDQAGQELSDTLGDLEDQGEDTGDALGKTSNVSTTLATAFSAARGDGQKLISDLSQIKGGFGGAVAGATALTAGFVALFQAGSRSIEAMERVQVVLGENADQIERLDVGGLSGELGKLAVQAGVSGGQLRIAAANIAQVGISSGATKGQVIETANNVNALALRAVALNPALGEAGAVAERMNMVLGRGGRFLTRYGIDLNIAEINARALADTGKSTVRELTQFERTTAGAALAVEKLGTSLGKDFQRGTEQSTVRLKSMSAELRSAFAGAGKPLVEPTIQAFDSLTEIATELSSVLGIVGQSALPAVAAILAGIGTLAIPLGLIADAFGAIPTPVLTAVAAFYAFRLVMSGTEGLIASSAVKMLDWGKNAKVGGDAITAVGGHVANFSDKMEKNVGHLAGAAAGALIAAQSFDQMGVSAEGTITGIAGMALAGSQIGAIFGHPAIGAGIGAAVGGIVSLGKALFDTGESTEEMNAKIAELSQSITGLGAAKASQKFLDEIGESAESMGEKFLLASKDAQTYARETGKPLSTANGIIVDAKNQVEEFRQKFRILAEENPAQAKRVAEGLRGIRDEAGRGFPTEQLVYMNKALGEGEKAHRRHAENAREDARANEEVAGTTTKASQAQDIQKKSLDQLTSSVSASIAGWQQLSSTITSSITESVPQAGAVFDQFTASVQRSFGDAAVGSIESYVEALDGSVTGTQQWLAEVQYLVGAGLEGLAALALSQGPEVGHNLVTSLQSTDPEYIEAWNAKLEQGNVALAQAQVDAEALGRQIGEAVRQGVVPSMDSLIGDLQTKAAQIGEWSAGVTWLVEQGLLGLAAVVSQQSPEIGAPLIAALKANTQEQLNEWNVQIVNQQDYLNESNAAIAAATPVIAGSAGTMGTLAASRFDAGVKGMAPAAQIAIGSTAGVMDQSSSILGSPAHIAGLTVGSQMGAGIYRGLHAWADDIADEAARIVRDAEAAAREEARSASPSRLFAELGGDLAAGVAVGMREDTPLVVREAEMIVQRAAAAAAPTPPTSIDPIVNVSVNPRVEVPAGVGSGGSTQIGPIYMESSDPEAVAREIEWRRKYGG